MWTDDHSLIALTSINYYLHDLGANTVSVTMEDEQEAIQLSLYLEANGIDTQVMPRVADECYPRENYIVLTRLRG